MGNSKTGSHLSAEITPRDRDAVLRTAPQGEALYEAGLEACGPMIFDLIYSELSRSGPVPPSQVTEFRHERTQAANYLRKLCPPGSRHQW